MTTDLNYAMTAIRMAGSITLVLNEGDATQISLTYNDPELNKAIATAIYSHYQKCERIAARRKTLSQAIGNRDSSAKALQKWLIKGYGVQEWSELDELTLTEFKDYLLNESGICRNSAKTYMRRLGVIIKTYGKAMGVPCDNYTDILKVGNDVPHKTYLDQKDLLKLEITATKTPKEAWVKCMFLVCSYTGCRISDALALTRENIQGNRLVYVSQKTKIQASVPLKPSVINWLEYIWEHPLTITQSGYNLVLRRICERAQNNDSVKVYKAGKEQTGEKWKFISSHTARISFATNMSIGGTPIQHIAQMMGHASTDQTMHYIVSHNFSLPAGAMQYLG